jgi:hypothetical protein
MKKIVLRKIDMREFNTKEINMKECIAIFNDIDLV